MAIQFHEHFKLLKSIHQYNTRQATSDNLYLFGARTGQYGKRSIQSIGSTLWNTS